VHSLLFIEDDDSIRLALRLALEDEGYEVREAPDGRTGLAMFVTCAIARISVEQFFRAAWPFFAALILLLLAMILFPWISLWIPHAMVK